MAPEGLRKQEGILKMLFQEGLMAPEGLRKQKRISEMLLQKGVMVPRGIRNRKMKENFRYAAPGRADGPSMGSAPEKKK